MASGSLYAFQPPFPLKPRRNLVQGTQPSPLSPESTHMSINELSFILAKNEGNTLNIPSQINPNPAPRRTPEPTSSRSPNISSTPPAPALDLPKRPAPAHIYYYPPARGVNHASGNGTVESRFYNEEARARGSNPVGASHFSIPPPF